MNYLDMMTMMNTCGGLGSYPMTGADMFGCGVGYLCTSIVGRGVNTIFDVAELEIYDSLSARRSRVSGGGGGGGKTTTTTTTTIRDRAKVKEDYDNMATLIANQLKSAGNNDLDAYTCTVEQVNAITIDVSFDKNIENAEKQYNSNGTGSTQTAYDSAKTAYDNSSNGYNALQTQIDSIVPQNGQTGLTEEQRNQQLILKGKQKELKDNLDIATRERNEAKTKYDDAIDAKTKEEKRLNGVKDNLKTHISQRDNFKTELDKIQETEATNGGVTVTEKASLTDADRKLLDDADRTVGERISKIKFDNDGNLIGFTDNSQQKGDDIKKSDLRKMINLYRNGNQAEKIKIKEWFKTHHKEIRDKEINSDIRSAINLIMQTDLA